MVADGTSKVDIASLSSIDLSTLTEEEKLELQKQVAMQRAQDIQAGIEASMTGDKAKLDELRAKARARAAEQNQKDEERIKELYRGFENISINRTKADPTERKGIGR